MIRRALLYWHTVRHLRPVQIAGRLRAALPRPTPALDPAPARRMRTGHWVMPAARRHSMHGPMTFGFLREAHRVSEGGWEPGSSLLWNYNLHYFDDLNASGAQARREWHVEAIANWIRSNSPVESIGWAPYPLSLRIVNWIKWSVSGDYLDKAAIDSLAVQVRALAARPEYHLLGNHLFANAKALVFAGLFFEGAEADGWLDAGLAILGREIPEQILPDGGQFERSPMYHALALEDVLDLVNVAGMFGGAIPARWERFVATWPALAQGMRDWLHNMCHPDGEIAFFNDAAIGVAPSPSELERYAGEVLGGKPRVGEPMDGAIRLVHLTDTGYLRVESADAVLLFDASPIGPDYLPGHAHADTLSFELSLFGQRVIVNGGTSRYGIGLERDAERGTTAHSTVVVDGENSSEVWAGFRVARRARPFDLGVTRQEGGVTFACSHDGYKRLRGSPIHRRTGFIGTGLLRIEDRVEGGAHAAVARFHFHPSLVIREEPGAADGQLQLSSGQCVKWRILKGMGHIEESAYCPEFGLRLASRCLAVELAAGGESCIEFAW